jgi:mannose-6-phosphate isomerase
MVQSGKPFALIPNRVRRTYSGGALLDLFRGEQVCSDSDRPESWIASAVRARNPQPLIEGEGLSCINDGELLIDQIRQDPVGMLGQNHVDRFGENPALLIKLLDSAERLTIQVHPDRPTAQKYYDSEFGKTEAWYVLGGRSIAGERPYILLGFRPGVTKAFWRSLFDLQDSEGMLSCLHRFEIEPGMVVFIPGGQPHAIGPGCFLAEMQEPTDLTLRVERRTPRGLDLPDSICHQGAGFERMLDSFDYFCRDRESVASTLIRYPVKTPGMQDSSFEARDLLSPSWRAPFSAETFKIRGSMPSTRGRSFSVVLVLGGTGKLFWDEESLNLEQGTELFLPASLDRVRWEADSGSTLHILECGPPDS